MKGTHMKQLRIAAVLAGSLVVAGAASPAVAAQTADRALPLDGLGDITSKAQKGAGAPSLDGRTKHGKGVANLPGVMSGQVVPLKGLPAVR
jgi:hypothetical protein